MDACILQGLLQWLCLNGWQDKTGNEAEPKGNVLAFCSEQTPHVETKNFPINPLYDSFNRGECERTIKLMLVLFKIT